MSEDAQKRCLSSVSPTYMIFTSAFRVRSSFFSFSDLRCKNVRSSSVPGRYLFLQLPPFRISPPRDRSQRIYLSHGLALAVMSSEGSAAERSYMGAKPGGGSDAGMVVAIVALYQHTIQVVVALALALI